MIRADAGVSLVNQDQDQDTNNVWIWGKPESGEGVSYFILLIELYTLRVKHFSGIIFKNSTRTKIS